MPPRPDLVLAVAHVEYGGVGGGRGRGGVDGMWGGGGGRGKLHGDAEEGAAGAVELA